jgi:hypothetical protein
MLTSFNVEWPMQFSCRFQPVLVLSYYLYAFYLSIFMDIKFEIIVNKRRPINTFLQLQCQIFEWIEKQGTVYLLATACGIPE